MNHVQNKQKSIPPGESLASSSNKTAAVNRLFLNLREGFSLTSSSTSSKSKNNNTIHCKNNANNNKTNKKDSSSNGLRANNTGIGGSENSSPYSIIPKSAPPTPSGGVREPAATAGDEFANWFARKLNFFSNSSSHAE
jgi:hypothetical protein